MSKKTHKILVALAVIITLLIAVVMVLVINPTNNTKITETKEKLLPFGSPTPPDDTIIVEPIVDDDPFYDTQPEVAQKLRRLVDEPVAGAISFNNEKGEVVIRYVEQKTGDIYDYSLNNKSSERIFQQTLLGIHDALWSSDGKNTVLRFLKTTGNEDTVKTYVVSFNDISSESPDEQVSDNNDPFGKFLPDDLLEVVISPDDKNVVYLQKEGVNSFILSENLSGDQEREQIFTSPFTEWLVEYPKEGLLALTTKPSYNIDGYLYFINIENGTMEKILGETKGLTALTNSGATKILYSKSEKDSHNLVVYNIETKTETILELNTFPEKCIWGGVENNNLLYCAVSNFTDNTSLPDEWYKGKVSFSDDIWLINTETGKSGIIAETEKFNKDGIDVIKPFLDPNDKHLLMTNKKDGALWMLELGMVEFSEYE